MLRYRAGDVAAFRRLYARHRGGVYRYLLRGCGHEDLAAELFQEVWASVVRARERYEPRARFTTWLYTLAHNRLVDHARAVRPETSPLDDDLPVATPAHEEPHARAEQQAQREGIMRALAALPLEQREAFLMKEEGGLSLEEIASATGVGRETVKSRLRYALARLREALRDVV